MHARLQCLTRSEGDSDKVMNDHLVPKTINLCVVKLAQTHSTRPAHGASFSWAKVGPMSGAQPVSGAQPMSEASALAEANALAEASAVGLGCVPRLDLDCFGSQSVSSRLNQRLPFHS